MEASGSDCPHTHAHTRHHTGRQWESTEGAGGSTRTHGRQRRSAVHGERTRGGSRCRTRQHLHCYALLVRVRQGRFFGRERGGEGRKRRRGRRGKRRLRVWAGRCRHHPLTPRVSAPREQLCFFLLHSPLLDRRGARSLCQAPSLPPFHHPYGRQAC